MSYRDELASAHEKIGRLESELAQARGPRTPKPKGSNAGVLVAVLILLCVGAGAGAGVWLVMRPAAEPPVLHLYSAEDRIPTGKRVRVRGNIVADSVRRRTDPCAVEFAIERAAGNIAVHSDQCVLPDTFGRPGFWIEVEGELDGDGRFETEEIYSKMKSFP